MERSTHLDQVGGSYPPAGVGNHTLGGFDHQMLDRVVRGSLHLGSMVDLVVEDRTVDWRRTDHRLEEVSKVADHMDLGLHNPHVPLLRDLRSCQ